MADEATLSPRLDDPTISLNSVNGGGLPGTQDDDGAPRGQKRPRPSAAADDDDDDEAAGGRERRKIEIKFISDKSRRHITFSKRKAGIMKKAYELSVLTGTQVLLLVVSETGLVYTFTTPKLQPLVTKPEGKNLIQACLNAQDPDTEVGNEEQSMAEVPEDPQHHMQQGMPRQVHPSQLQAMPNQGPYLSQDQQTQRMYPVPYPQNLAQQAGGYGNMMPNSLPPHPH